MLGTHFDLAKEVAAIAARKELVARSASCDESLEDPAFELGTPAELDYLLDQFAGRQPKTHAADVSRG